MQRTTRDGLEVVLKRYPKADVQGLKREMNASFVRAHRNVVKITGVVREGDYTYIEMPYAPHGNVLQWKSSLDPAPSDFMVMKCMEQVGWQSWSRPSRARCCGENGMCVTGRRWRVWRSCMRAGSYTAT